MVHIVKNRVDINDVCIDEQAQYRVRDTSTGEEYFAAFIKHVGVYLMQPLEWLFNVGRFEPIGDSVQVMPSVEIIGTVTEVYEIYRDYYDIDVSENMVIEIEKLKKLAKKLMLHILILK